MKKIPISTKTFSILGGLTLFAFFAPSIAIFSFNSIFHTDQINMPSEEEIEVENNWIEAEGTLSAFYNYLNLHDFEKARKQLSDDFAKKESNYSIASLTEWALKKQTDTKIKNLVREPGLSKKTTKVFSYETQYDLADGGKNCGEKLTAYIVLRDEKWTIDTIHPNGYIKCEY